MREGIMIKGEEEKKYVKAKDAICANCVWSNNRRRKPEKLKLHKTKASS